MTNAKTKAPIPIEIDSELTEVPCRANANARPAPRITTNINFENGLFCFIKGALMG
jgi:hypothetical protein